MLESTFKHLVGIGNKSEQSLWKNKVLSWDEYAKSKNYQLSLFEKDSELSRGREALLSGDLDYFRDRLEKKDYYRIALSVPNDVLFLDIETTGLSLYYDQITMVGWSQNSVYGTYIKGQRKEPFVNALSEAKVIVTYNGTIFDIKFLKKEFEGIEIPSVHIDLRFFLKGLGLTGGQKQIEDEIGFKRPKSIKNLKGEGAPVLWHQYRRGDIKALKTLIIYNHCDVEGMKFLLDRGVQLAFERDAVPKIIRSKHNFRANKGLLRWDQKKYGDKATPLPKYTGSTKPLITYDELNAIISLDDFSVAGIDLVSSEDRETGFCLLKGSLAKTCRVKTDDEMIEMVLAMDVDLVSIDSPLSIPAGRTSYFDDDPKREEFGIMRYCELLLKRRGVNSYPALIPSMQKLTKRGVELATKIRKLGIPVIESYPGAAQDIMTIPRKQAGLEYLALGMEEFGINGEYTKEQVSHDELDAITSAIVGHFFATGMFEALGNAEEEYLYIPDLSADPKLWKSRRVIGLSGAIAAGKTTIAEMLEKSDFKNFRYSKVLNDMLLRDNIEVTRSNLQKLGVEVNQTRGQRWLGSELTKKISNEPKVVIDGLRFLEDYSFLRETYGPGFIHIHVSAPWEMREQRLSNRTGEDLSLLEAEKQGTEQESNLLKDKADIVIANDSTILELGKILKRKVT